MRPLWHRPGPVGGNPADAVAPLEPARAPPSILVCSACGGGALLSASMATGLKVLPKSSMRSTCFALGLGFGFGLGFGLGLGFGFGFGLGLGLGFGLGLGLGLGLG